MLAFNESQEDATNGSAAYHRYKSGSGGQNASSQRSAQYGIPRVFFTTTADQGALDSREKAAPDSKVAGDLGNTVFYCRQAAVEASLESRWCVSETDGALLEEKND